jgi:hypothetical protein
MWIPSPGELAAVGFGWDKIRTVEDGTLAGFVDKPFLPPAPTKASDVFLAPLKNCANYSSYVLPLRWGRCFPNCQAQESLMAQNVIVVGWLIDEPFVNLCTRGCEDVHYDIKLDPDFVERMYGRGGLSTLLNGRSYQGNLVGDSGATTVKMPALPVEDRSELDGKSKGITFNSFILPGNGGSDIHGELNAWHEFDTTGYSGQFDWPSHFLGRGPAPQGWTQVTVDGMPTPDAGGEPVYTKDTPWFPWDIHAPSGDPLHAGDYVLMRGPIWQDVLHGGDMSPEKSAWHSGATFGHEGWVEVHPIDWIVRLQPRPIGVRKTVGRIACATVAGQDSAAEAPPVDIRAEWPDFAPASFTNGVAVRDVREVIDGRCSDMATVSPDPRWERSDDHVVAKARVQGTAAQQGRFKASYIVSWRETQALDRSWFDDELPPTAHPQGNEPWTWVTNSPKPFSGTRSHQSASTPGMHQHFFDSATPARSVAFRGYLFAMVYLDPDDAPREIMLQWNDGSWEHRAFWGDDLIGWGVDGTPSRMRIGALPESGEWMRLEVPASVVALEGHTVGGMAFTLWGGRATWDYVGVSAPSPFQ